MNKILVVEDNKNIITVLRICLQNAGYEVKTVSNGVKAVETAFEWKPDLILLDIKIPKMNGFLVCETLKDEEVTANTPIIMLSAKAEEENIKKAYNLGAEGYITKPIEPKRLLAEIDKYL
ncbi:response regulator [Acetohalobium arabaticum]|uniref:Stage 0 sporulation protein A homolog n=1 Tax=Acetohalobium arabaticum (strain ATCC 49924 / DSM 5501 / Z-7288) TaxID=574087 RepID=D9QQU5_ACEAZ|nr:response regulator [Acetohalobium arabaticum]ADL12886.1 response regulator receiver protein [Acetohalobium arabaticum DSM 5501]